MKALQLDDRLFALEKTVLGLVLVEILNIADGKLYVRRWRSDARAWGPREEYDEARAAGLFPPTIEDKRLRQVKHLRA